MVNKHELILSYSDSVAGSC